MAQSLFDDVATRCPLHGEFIPARPSAVCRRFFCRHQQSRCVFSITIEFFVTRFFFSPLFGMSAGDFTFRLACTLSNIVTGVVSSQPLSPMPAYGPFSPAQLSLLINQPALVGSLPAGGSFALNAPRRFQVNSVSLTVASPDSGWVSRPLLGLGHSVPLEMSHILASPRAAGFAGPDPTYPSVFTNTLDAVSTSLPAQSLSAASLAAAHQLAPTLSVTITDAATTTASRPPLAVALTPFALASLASSNPAQAPGVVSTAAWAQVLASHAGDAATHRYSPYELLGVAKSPLTPRPSTDTSVAPPVPTTPARASCPWLGLELCVNVRDMDRNQTIQLRSPVLVCRAPKNLTAVSSPAPLLASTPTPTNNGESMIWHRKWEAETEARGTQEQGKATATLQTQASTSSSSAPPPPPPQT
jgi:hypothetical protein